MHHLHNECLHLSCSQGNIFIMLSFLKSPKDIVLLKPLDNSFILSRAEILVFHTEQYRITKMWAQCLLSPWEPPQQNHPLQQGLMSTS